MLLTSFVYKKMLSMPHVPPESGGILGGSNKIISEFIFDEGISNIDSAIYKPNTTFLNKQIENWSNRNIELYGIVHTHPKKQNTLSVDDMEYIKKILLAAPSNISYLFFPVVLPHFKVFSYIATLEEGKLTIYADDIIII